MSKTLAINRQCVRAAPRFKASIDSRAVQDNQGDIQGGVPRCTLSAAIFNGLAPLTQ
jgi:hypothetical protein